MKRRLTILITAVVLVAALAGCAPFVTWHGQPNNSEVVEGTPSGTATTYTAKTEVSGLRVEYIDLFSSGGVIDLEIVYGAEWSVTVPDLSGIPDRYALKVSEDRGYLVVSGENRILYDVRDIKITLTCPKMPNLDLRGAYNVTSADAFEGDSATLHVAGASNIEMEATLSGGVDIDIAGAAKIKLGGKAESMTANVAGVCTLDSLDMIVEDAEVNIAGTGNCDVYVTRSLDVTIAGAGALRYKTGGNAVNISRTIAGLGTVHCID